MKIVDALISEGSPVWEVALCNDDEHRTFKGVVTKISPATCKNERGEPCDFEVRFEGYTKGFSLLALGVRVFDNIDDAYLAIRRLTGEEPDPWEKLQ